MNHELKIGDVVQLKSGGPKMTISKIILGYQTKKANGVVSCMWFNEENKPCEKDFKIETLKKIS